MVIFFFDFLEMSISRMAISRNNCSRCNFADTTINSHTVPYFMFPFVVSFKYFGLFVELFFHYPEVNGNTVKCIKNFKNVRFRFSCSYLKKIASTDMSEWEWTDVICFFDHRAHIRLFVVKPKWNGFLYSVNHNSVTWSYSSMNCCVMLSQINGDYCSYN